MSNWPKPGDKLTFRGIGEKEWFYPHFTNIIDNAKKNLIPGQTYTVTKSKVYSSWCAVWLDELPGEDNKFHFTMFNV